MEGTMTGLNLHELKNEAEKRVQRGELKIAHQREIISVLERSGRNTTAAMRLLNFLERTQASDVVDRDWLVTRAGGN
jgi:ABC-type histidine transport system ATPase subunit